MTLRQISQEPPERRQELFTQLIDAHTTYNMSSYGMTPESARSRAIANWAAIAICVDISLPRRQFLQRYHGDFRIAYADPHQYGATMELVAHETKLRGRELLDYIRND